MQIKWFYFLDHKHIAIHIHEHTDTIQQLKDYTYTSYIHSDLHYSGQSNLHYDRWHITIPYNVAIWTLECRSGSRVF